MIRFFKDLCSAVKTTNKELFEFDCVVVLQSTDPEMCGSLLGANRIHFNYSGVHTFYLGFIAVFFDG